MSDRFYIGETVHGSSYIIDRASQRSAIGRSGSFVVAIDSGEASWVCAALNEKQDRDNATDAEPTGEPCEPIVADCDGCGQQIQNWEGVVAYTEGTFCNRACFDVHHPTTKTPGEGE